MKRLSVLAVPLLIAALAAAGCGSSNSSSGSGSTSSDSSSSGASTTSGSSGGATQTSASTAVKTASVAKVGTVLVGPQGRAVYVYTPDTGTTSTCYGACATAWPPLTTSARATAGSGAMASQLGTTKRRDGTVQVTYAGHPLYYFAGDKSPGTANGQGLEGIWWVMTAGGKEIRSGASGKSDGDSDGASSSGGSSSSSGGGSGSGSGSY